MNDTLKRKSILLSRLLCIISAVFPLAAALGWFFDIPFLTQILPGLPAMQPNTIVGLILAVVCIFLLTQKLPKTLAPWLSVLGLLILALGLSSLGEYSLDLNWGIDRLFVHKGIDYHQPFPGRPSPQAAANFALLGISICLHFWRSKKFYLMQSIIYFVAANSIFALTGYIFGTSRYYGLPIVQSTIGLALNTGITFLLLSISLLYSRPSEGFMQLLTSGTRSGRVARLISLLCIFVPPIVGLLTKLGFLLGWYSSDIQVSLFAVVLIGLLLWATWRASSQAEKDELLARHALEEARLANEKLQRALDEKEVFSAFVENSADFIGIADPNGKLIYVNPAGRRMVEMPAEAVVQDTQIQEYYPPEQRGFAQDVIVKSMVENGRWSGETYFRNWKTGKSIPVSDEHFMICEKGSGRILGMGTITRDITTIRDAQERLAQSERRFRSIFDNSIDAVILAAPDGTIAMANAAAITLFGFSEEDLKKKGRQAVVYFTDPALATETEERRKTGHYKGDITMRRKDGSLFPGELSSAVFKDEHGNEWTSMFIRDITDRKKSENERDLLLRQIDYEKRWLEAVFEGAPIGVVIVRIEDPEHPIPNAHARTIFGSRINWKAGRVSYLGQAHDAKGKPLDKEELTSSRVLRGETIIGEEQLLKFNDGREFPIVVAGGPILDKIGKQMGGVAFFQDISPLKELERLREEWAAVIAHDLRQPITAIQMQANLLRKLPEMSGKGLRLAEMIESSAKQLNRMTHDLLDVSQLEANQLKLDPKWVEPVKIIQDIVEKLKPLYPSNEIQVKVDGPTEKIKVDSGRMEQVIGNLISNASKYGYARTNILLEVSQSGHWVEIAITNHGRGIDSGEIGKLFQRFHRTQLGKIEGIKGIGLGLYITRGLIEAHGGEIRAESLPGETTTFRIRLPAGELNQKESSAQKVG